MLRCLAFLLTVLLPLCGQERMPLPLSMPGIRIKQEDRSQSARLHDLRIGVKVVGPCGHHHLGADSLQSPGPRIGRRTGLPPGRGADCHPLRHGCEWPPAGRGGGGKGQGAHRLRGDRAPQRGSRPAGEDCGQQLQGPGLPHSRQGLQARGAGLRTGIARCGHPGSALPVAPGLRGKGGHLLPAGGGAGSARGAPRHLQPPCQFRLQGRAAGLRGRRDPPGLCAQHAPGGGDSSGRGQRSGLRGAPGWSGLLLRDGASAPAQGSQGAAQAPACCLGRLRQRPQP